MKKLLINLTLVSLLFFIILLITLSTIGVKTNKFNGFIKEKISEKEKINLELKIIKFKIDPKKLSLFLETENPNINYSDVTVPVQNLKVYVDGLSLIKMRPKIKKINLSLDELDVAQLNKISRFIKPSNFKSFLNNKIKKGKLITEIEIFLDEEGLFKDFIAKGTVKDLQAEFLGSLNLTNTNLSFFADKNDVIVKNIIGNFEDIKIHDGDIKLNLENGVKLNSNFNSNISLNKTLLNKYKKFFKKNNFLSQLNNLEADLSNNFYVAFDKTYKVIDYNYNLSGNLKKGEFLLFEEIKNDFMKEEIKKVYLSDIKFQSIFNPQSIKLNGNGKYSFNNLEFLKINLENNFINNENNLKLNFDFKESLKLEFLNYKKPKNSLSNFSINLKKKKNYIEINELYYNEKNNFIKINDLIFENNKLLSFKEFSVETINNNFFIRNGKKILIKGTKFDATNLAKYFNRKSKKNKFEKISGDIEIEFKNIKAPMSEKLQNFRLLGKIKNGKFEKITSKGDFGGNNFLDISMKKNINSNKKYLEIYSDLPSPLLTEYSFFNGLSGGKLLYSSVIDGSKTFSNIKIENFKVINAPSIIQLLSLADLGGLADLTKGEGLSFDTLDIDIENSDGFIKIKEILALGPSVSVLMDGYQDKAGLTSLRGTLVPAKTLNKMISKIPILGDLVIPKEIGEGLFGISFKMKGPKGNIKTSINPIRTLTPRFIQKIIDKKKIK
jgi:hypothetical protein